MTHTFTAARHVFRYRLEQASHRTEGPDTKLQPGISRHSRPVRKECSAGSRPPSPYLSRNRRSCKGDILRPKHLPNMAPSLKTFGSRSVPNRLRVDSEDCGRRHSGFLYRLGNSVNDLQGEPRTFELAIRKCCGQLSWSHVQSYKR